MKAVLFMSPKTMAMTRLGKKLTLLWEDKIKSMSHVESNMITMGSSIQRAYPTTVAKVSQCREEPTTILRVGFSSSLNQLKTPLKLSFTRLMRFMAKKLTPMVPP